MKLATEWVALKTIIIREARRAFRVWPQSFLPAVITTVLYFVIFGRVIGARIGPMEGFSYVQYIAPGLIMLQIITSSYTSSVSSFFIAKFQRQIQELLISPMSAIVLLLGYMLGGMARGLIVGIIVTIIALFFTRLHLHSLFFIILIALSCSCLFSLAGLVNAIFAKNFDDISIIPTFALTPLTYLGGVFYSINLLPKTWQYVSFINPIVYIVNAFRYGFLGVADASIATAFTVTTVFIVILFIIAYYLITRGVGLRD